MTAKAIFWSGGGLFLLLFQAARNARLGFSDVLLPGGGIDNGLGFAGFALLQLFDAFKDAAVR
jgi:hypothetical protein